MATDFAKRLEITLDRIRSFRSAVSAAEHAGCPDGVDPVIHEAHLNGMRSMVETLEKEAVELRAELDIEKAKKQVSPEFLALIRWLNDGGHLPSFLKDFHDQKDVFKLVHHLGENVPKRFPIPEDLSWIDAQCYTIDCFLKAMGLFGYTLQKSRTRHEFSDLHKAVGEMQEETARNLEKLFASKRPASYPESQEVGSSAAAD